MWISFWRFYENQKQTSKFHPIWIVLVATITLVIAGIVWIPALVVPRIEPITPHSPLMVPPVSKVLLV